MPEQLFLFIQMEFPWALGPADGRYLLRAHRMASPSTSSCSARSAPGAGRSALRRGAGRRLARGACAAASASPADPRAGARWPRRGRRSIDPVSLSAEQPGPRVAGGPRPRPRRRRGRRGAQPRAAHPPDRHGRPLHPRGLPRAGARDQGRAGARASRWPTGAGCTPASSRRRFPAPAGREAAPARIAPALRPQERLAALLGARGSTCCARSWCCEHALDLDHDRVAHAAVELDRAYCRALPELGAEQRQDLAIRGSTSSSSCAPGSASRRRPRCAGERPERSRRGGLRHALERLEATLRARTAAGFHALK